VDYIQSIRAFVAVVRLESFTKAARQMDLSLASLSRAVSNLESHTQTRLVNRSSRYVSLAPGAREYFDICVEVLERLHEGEQRLMNERVEPRGMLRIAAHPIAIEAGLPQVVSQYQHGAPEVEVVLNTRTSPLRLEHDKYDVAVYPPELILDADAVCRRFLNSPIVLVASDAYLDRTRFDRSRPESSSHVILSCQGDVKAEQVLRLERAGKTTTLAPGSIRMSVSEPTALRLALSGFGIGLLPEFLAAPHLADGTLRLVFPDHQLIGEAAALSVAYMRHGTIPRRIRSFVDTCMRFFGFDGGKDVKASFELAA
jgi:DNA-binding transcriptional LysR family regulator